MIRKQISIEVLPSTQDVFSNSDALEILVGDSRLHVKDMDAYKAHLSQSERMRSERFVRAIDRQTYVATHYFLRKRLSGYLKTELARIEIVQEKGQKPRLKNDERGFNISHSGNHFAVAVSEHEGLSIGVDIEELSSNVNVDDIASGFMHPEEIAYINGALLDEGLKLSRFLEMWTRKEALLKQLGIGIVVNLKELNLTDGVRTMDLEFKEDYTIYGDTAVISSCFSENYILSLSSSSLRIPSIYRV